MSKAMPRATSSHLNDLEPKCVCNHAHKHHHGQNGPCLVLHRNEDGNVCPCKNYVQRVEPVPVTVLDELPAKRLTSR
jgi:hypothetical protein